jgi:antitoxin component of MazEF toxin-antitoxin module
MGYQDSKKRSLPWWRRPVILLVLGTGLIVIPWAWVLLFALLPVLLVQAGNRGRQKLIADASDVNEESQASLVRQESSTSPPPIAPVENPPKVEERSEPAPRLEGAALVAKIKSVSGLSKADIVRACGYVSRKKNGSERLDFLAFYEALLEAKGLQAGSRESAAMPNPRSIKKRIKGNESFQVLVANEGSVLLTRGCARQLDLQPGDKFRVRLKSGAIILDPVDLDEDAEVEQPCLASHRMHWHATVDNENNILIPTDSLREIGLIPGQKLLAELGPATIALEPVQRSRPAAS